MKKSLIISSLALGCLTLVLGLVLAPKVHAAPTPTITGQGIMVNLTFNGNLALVQTDTYSFNKTTAATYFTNAWDGNAPTVAPKNNSYPKITTSDALTATANPDPIPTVEPACTPAVSTPNAPAAIDSNLNNGNPNSKNDVAGKNDCNFLNGNLLEGATYQQDVDSGEVSCSYISAVVRNPLTTGPPADRGKYKVTTTTVTYNNTYTYTYNITPNAPGVFPMLTAWDFVGSTGDTSALVNMDANIAGESAVSSKQWNRKYSFSLGEDPLDPTLSRVQNLAISVNDVVQATPASTVYHNTPPDGLVDFDYVTNAGMNGHTELLTNGDARTILNTDNFAGNDNGGSDGEALAWAIMDTVQLQLPVGDYTIKFTGTVKGNSGAADIPFSITQLLTIHGPGCQPIVVP